MNLSTMAPLVYLWATGRLITITQGDSNWVKIIPYIQVNLGQWARERGMLWESLYHPGVASGTITATDTFNLPSGILGVSNKAHDYIYILWSNGVNYTRYKTVPGYQLKDHRRGERRVSVSGVASITFSQPFTETDNEYGGTLYVPCYSAPATPVNPTDIPQIDDPYWLIYMAAQDWAQVDVTLVQNVPSLVAKAQNSMTNMKLANQRMRTESQMTADRTRRVWPWY